MAISSPLTTPMRPGGFGHRPMQNPQQNYGMFGSTDPYYSSFKPSVGPGAGAPTYDLSGIRQGWDYLKNISPFAKTSYDPYQFTTPQYKTNSPQDIASAYSTGFGAAAHPLRARGEEVMRNQRQGFDSRHFGGAANRELAMKTAMRTGEDLRDVARGIGSNIATQTLGEKADANKAMFAAELDRQRQQAAENFGAASFGAGQSQYLSDELTKRAGLFKDYAFDLPALQAKLTETNAGLYRDILGMSAPLYQTA